MCKVKSWLAHKNTIIHYLSPLKLYRKTQWEKPIQRKVWCHHCGSRAVSMNWSIIKRKTCKRFRLRLYSWRFWSVCWHIWEKIKRGNYKLKYGKSRSNTNTWTEFDKMSAGLRLLFSCTNLMLLLVCSSFIWCAFKSMCLLRSNTCCFLINVIANVLSIFNSITSNLNSVLGWLYCNSENSHHIHIFFLPQVESATYNASAELNIMSYKWSKVFVFSICKINFSFNCRRNVKFEREGSFYRFRMFHIMFFK